MKRFLLAALAAPLLGASFSGVPLPGARSASSARAATPLFEPLDLFQLQLVTNPVVSPDGHRILFTRNAFDRDLDRQTIELWLAQIDDNGRFIDKRLLVARDVFPRQFRFSPDGSRIAYIAQARDRAQIFTMALADAVGQQLTTGFLLPENPVWSPDGTKIAFVGRQPEQPPRIPGLPPRLSGPGVYQAPDAKIITDLFWRVDGFGETPPGTRQIFVVDVETAAIIRISSGAEGVPGDGSLAWTKDGKALLASVLPDPLNKPAESDIWRFPAVASRNGMAPPPVRLTTRAGSEYAPRPAPDGRTIAFLGAGATTDFYPMPQLWLTPAEAGGAPRLLSAALDRPIRSFDWEEDGQAIDIFYNDEGRQKMARIAVADGAITPLGPDVGINRVYLPTSAGQASCRGGTCAFTSAFADRPAGLGVERGGHPADVLDFNRAWATTKKPARIEEIRTETEAGNNDASNGENAAPAIQGWIVYPPDFDPGRRYPLILDIHGGPNTDFGPYFSLTHSLFASAGYIVLYGNPRGSIGYGRAFANAITGAYPGPDYNDLMALLAEAEKRPYVDRANLFITGGSGGGLMTLWAIGRDPDRFRAAAALRPVVDWANEATTSDSAAYFLHQWMGVAPWDDPTFYARQSPFSLAGRIKTPVMLVTGEADYRTPIGQTEQMFGALKLRGVETEMVRLPGAGHGMGRPSQWLQSIMAPLDWFNRHRSSR